MKSLLFLCIFFLLAGNVSASEIILVVSKDSPIDTTTTSELKKLFIGKQTTLDNSFVSPTILKNKSLHKDFIKTFLRMNTRQFARIWQKLVFTGKAQMPNHFQSQTELIKMLSESPDKIGYIERKRLTTTLKEVTISK